MKLEKIDKTTVLEPVGPASCTMRADKVFWSHFSPNLAPSAWIVGMVVVSMGLSGWRGFLVLVLGNLIGTLPVAFCAAMGPSTGLPQVEASRLSLGRLGKRVPAFINWASCVGWNAVNNVPSATALVILAGMFGLPLSLWLALSILAFVQMVASVGGHDVVQAVEKYLGWVLLALFCLCGVMAARHAHGMLMHATIAASLAQSVTAVGMVAGFNMVWAAYASDYTRYVHPEIPARQVFLLTFLGTSLSALLMEFFGILTGATLADASPSALISALAKWTGPFASLALAAVALSAVAINAANITTASYSLISGGVHVNRMVSAAVTAGLGFLLSVAGGGRFVSLYESYLLLALYWVAPWAGIVLADWYASSHPERMRRLRAPTRWTRSATLFVVTCVLTMALFSSTPLYVGPIARALGGADIGYFVGFALAAGLQLRFSIVDSANHRKRPCNVPMDQRRGVS